MPHLLSFLVIAVWTTVSTLGLGALLHRSEMLFTAVKLAGAAIWSSSACKPLALVAARAARRARRSGESPIAVRSGDPQQPS